MRASFFLSVLAAAAAMVSAVPMFTNGNDDSLIARSEGLAARSNDHFELSERDVFDDVNVYERDISDYTDLMAVGLLRREFEESELRRRETCAICQEKIVGTAISHCANAKDHWQCKSCYDKNVLSLNCPMCRGETTPDSVYEKVCKATPPPSPKKKTSNSSIKSKKTGKK